MTPDARPSDDKIRHALDYALKRIDGRIVNTTLHPADPVSVERLSAINALSWLISNRAALLSSEEDRQRMDASPRDLFRSGYLCGATESISDTREGLEREANAAADAFIAFVAARSSPSPTTPTP